MNVMANKYSGIIFDYGGTLDTRGDHWSEVIWDGYRHESVPVGKQAFRDAYVYAERVLAVNPVVKADFHFADILRAKIRLQLAFLSGRELLHTGKDDAEKQKQLGSLLEFTDEQIEITAARMADYINGITNCLLNENRSVLEYLHRKGLPMVLVSNFYGNISTVLRDAGMDIFFQKVIESAVVGVRKPNPAIFALGVCALDMLCSEVLVVGDSYSKDIVPAKDLGCHAVWIKGRQWEDAVCDESICDAVVTRLSDIEHFI